MMKIPFIYNIRSLWQRRVTTILTIGGITLVVFIFAAVLMLANGLEQSLIVTGSDDNVIFLRKSATTEVMSSISRDAKRAIETFQEIELSSAESVSIINLRKEKTGELGNVTIRGVTKNSLPLRQQITISGKMVEPGSLQAVVGKSIANQFENCQVGKEFTLAQQNWKVVGIIECQGAAFESEIWVDVDQLMSNLKRPFSSVLCRLKNPKDVDIIKQHIDFNSDLQQVEIKAEKKYYADQSAMMATFIRVLGIFVTLIFSLAAIIGAMITMYSAVANRTKIIATLRVLGFQRLSILIAFLFEAIFISFCGGVFGIALASLLQFVKISTLNFGTYTETAFDFKMSTNIVIASLCFSLFMGVIGGFLPAVRAARLRIVAALR